MITVPARLGVLIATKPVDFRKGADGLAAAVRETLGDDPFSGSIYVLRSKRVDRVKMLAWDGTGLVLLWKRLESGAFKWPPITDGVMRLTSGNWLHLSMGWIGRGCMRTTLRGRRQRRESCDFLNQIRVASNTTERESDSISSCRSMLPLTISMPCESWWLSCRANAMPRWKNAGA